MLTIRDIARKGGVSTATVSRVLNNSGYVRKDVRDRVIKIIEENNYSPSATARSLSRQETNIIGVIVPSINNPFFAEALEGVTKIVDKNDLTLIYYDTQEDRRKEERALAMVSEQRVRGLIFTPSSANGKADFQKLKAMLTYIDVPVVLLDRPIPDSNFDGVYFDGYSGSYQAVKALIANGHKKIANITCDLNVKILADRFRGYKQALTDHGIKVDDRYIFISDSYLESSYRLALKMLAMKDPPTAVHTSNNDTTLGFLKAVTQMGLKIPDDIAFVGFDKLQVLEDIGVHYSFVDRDVEKMGEVAMDLLLKRIKEKKRQKEEIIFPPVLVMNGSEK